MKLRLRGSSIRLRLTQGEVRALAETGRVEETVHFAPGSDFGYVLAASTDAPVIDAGFEGNAIVVTVPLAMVQDWASGGAVGLEAERATDRGSLRILIEKDFACLKPRGEDETDMFPHPRN